MANVRFASVVENSGRPEVYLILTDPAKDAHFQAALKAHRLMTVQHGSASSKTSFGTVGYLPEVKGEVLIFPRSLRSFADDRIVGINFDLLEQEREPVEDEPEPKPVAKARPKIEPMPDPPRAVKQEAKAEPKPTAKAAKQHKGKKHDHNQAELPMEREAPRPPAKVLSFHAEAEDSGDEEEPDDSATVAELKKEIRRALKALEAGKQVVAFNVLKKILE